ncbi:MAG: A/G-specific adenine glycosylase [Bradymonadia bacterium]
MQSTPSTFVSESILSWYDQGHRDLPWRRQKDPWGIWVSEIMAQQTRVESVIPYWERFIGLYPTPGHLAAAPLDDLLALWAGLGYYARARNLYKGATQVVERHGGVIPDDPEAFGALAGVGRYTCGAVMSIAFGRQTPVVDGNVVRVLARFDRIHDDPRAPATQRRLWARAEALVPKKRPGDFNQGLMELGATVCTPKSPTCLLCPLSSQCQGLAHGEIDRLPMKKKATPRKKAVRVAGLSFTEAGEVWLAQRPAEGLLGGLWELPAITVEGADVDQLGAQLKTLGLEVTGEARVITHAFTHLEWTVYVFPAQGTPAGGSAVAYRAVAPESLIDAGLTGPALKALRAWKVKGAPKRRGSGKS